MPDLVWMRPNSWVFECVSIFSGNFCCECTAAFTVLPRGSWCRQCVCDCSTEHFTLRSRMLRLISAFYHQRRWCGGTWTLNFWTLPCYIKKQKGQEVCNGDMESKSSGHSHESHATFCLCFFMPQPWPEALCFRVVLKWSVTTTPWRMWQSFDRTWPGQKTERRIRQLRTKKTECIYQLTPTVQYILLKRTMKFC